MSFSKKDLLKYCDEHEIAVSANASRKEIEAAIFRAGSHLESVVDKTCFGYWEDDNVTCDFCSFKSECKESSLGTKKPIKRVGVRLDGKRKKK